MSAAVPPAASMSMTAPKPKLSSSGCATTAGALAQADSRRPGRAAGPREGTGAFKMPF